MSQAYNILKRLEQQGYIEGSDSPQKKGPDRYELQATAAGRAHFRQWLLAPSGIATQALRVEFLTRLYFARTDSEKLVAQVIHGQIEATSEGLKQLRKRQSLLAPSSQINEWALQLRIRQLGSFLDWLKQLNPNSIHQHPAEGDSTIR